MSRFYAVKNGRKPGIYLSWPECEAQVKGFSGAQYKSFKTKEEAEAFIGVSSAPTAAPTVPASPAKMKINPLAPLDVYVDGSYANGKYSWAFVVYKNGQVIHQDYGVGTNAAAATMNNVAGELAATMRAVKWAAANKKKVVIHHDYQGISSWVDGSWKAKNEFTQAYRDFMASYKPIVKFNKVAGHTGIEGNELADKLAKKALGI